MKKILFLVALILLSSCATAPTGPTYSEFKPSQTGKNASLIFYRSYGFKGAAYNNSVYINDVLAAKLPVSSFTYFDLLPGKYEISSGPPGTPKGVHFSFNAEPGMKYFIEYYSPDSLMGREGIRLVPETDALADLQSGYRLVPALEQSPKTLP